MIYNLINYDRESGGYDFIGNINNWNLVDYYIDDELQPDSVKVEMFEELRRRSAHNIWMVTRIEGTLETLRLCDEMEEALQKNEKYYVLEGYIIPKIQNI